MYFWRAESISDWARLRHFMAYGENTVASRHRDTHKGMS